jgi:hypothetical protein
MATDSFVGVRVQGGLLPAELLSRIAVGALAGQASADYHLAAGETVREAANRAWAYLTGVWAAYHQAAVKLPEADRGTTLTRDRWLMILLRELGYGRVSATPAGGLIAGEKQMPVSHVWEHVPMHLLGHRIELDRRTQGVAGAATSSPQSMVQELLNRSDAHLWAILSNGLTLRLLRDSTSLVGSAYVEFDLEAIFDGDLFADFLLLFSVCHESRLEVRDSEKGAASCWLEVWRTESLESGSRALDQLCHSVIQAITTLGTGFLAHPSNVHLRDGLAEGSLRIEDVNHGLLRVVYRLLFTFVAEDRGLLLAPDAEPLARQRYRDYFSTARLRRTSRRRRGTRHADQWRALNVVWDGLGSVDGRPELGLVGIGGLFEPGALDLFRGCELPNEALLRAVRHLSLVEEPGSKVKRVVDYRNLGAEELGSIYEDLLEFVPSWDAGRRMFELLSAAGNDRKSTGSYYTPTSLIDCLLDSALDPVLERAERQPDPEAALLALTVCDPACGSGHFLVAAARRIAKRVAAIRTGDPEPPPERVREALGDVVGRCIYGVDLNPLAAELAKVSLWLETLDPGRPLAFLDAQIRVGNSLIGATPELLASGVPDKAFSPIEGDDPMTVERHRRQNRAERLGQDDLFQSGSMTAEAIAFGELVASPRALSLSDVHARHEQLHALQSDPVVMQRKLLADAWCAAFFSGRREGSPTPVTEGTVRALERGESLSAGTEGLIRALTVEHRFFHWHLEFPHLFREGSSDTEVPGFDVILGNPPWERIALEDKDFFEFSAPEVLESETTDKRKQAIERLEVTEPQLYSRYREEIQQRQKLSRFFAESTIYEFSAAGRLNTQSLFTERCFQLIRGRGRVGLVIPTGVLTDTPMKDFWRWLVDSRRAEGIIDFENKKKIFPIHASYNFVLFTANGGLPDVGSKLRVATRLTGVDELSVAGRLFSFNLADLDRINPSTRQLPLCRNQREIDILLRITDSADVIAKRGWVGFTSEANSKDYLSEWGSGLVGLYEGKLMHQFDAAFAAYAQVGLGEKRAGKPRRTSLDERNSPIRPRFWVQRATALRFLSSKHLPSTEWVLVVRDYARASDDRTAIAAILPTTVPIQPLNGITTASALDALFCVASMNSFCYDWTARQRTPGQHFNVTILGQTPASYPTSELRALTFRRALELSYTQEALFAFASECGLVRAPYPWDNEKRELMARELDAVFFLSAKLAREDVAYIMDSFTSRRDYDKSQFGEFRTKRLVLDFYDSMHRALTSGDSYVSSIDGDANDK